MRQATLTFEQIHESLDRYIVEQLSKDATFQLQMVDADELVTANRFDLLMKIAFLDTDCTSLGSGYEIYHADIRTQTLGDFTEFTDHSKAGIEEYVVRFRRILHDLRNGSFDWERSLIPLARDGSLLNGSHRVAAAVVAGVPVATLQTNIAPLPLGFEHFRRCGVRKEILEAAILRALPYLRDLRLALVWPSGSGITDEAVKAFHPALFTSRVQLDGRAPTNLTREVYRRCDWLYDSHGRPTGLTTKALASFRGGRDLTLILFRDSDVTRVQQRKEALRRRLGDGTDFVHTTDTCQESLEVAQLLLSPSGQDWLEHSSCEEGTLSGIMTEFDSVTQPLPDGSRATIDGSSVLELYGIRKAADLDVLAIDRSSTLLVGYPNLRTFEEARFHGDDVASIFTDPRRHFSLRGRQIVSLEQVVEFKRRRDEPKDRVDMASLKRAFGRASPLDSWKSQVSFFGVRTRYRLRSTLARHIVGSRLHRPLSWAYRRFFKHDSSH